MALGFDRIVEFFSTPEGIAVLSALSFVVSTIVGYLGFRIVYRLGSHVPNPARRFIPEGPVGLLLYAFVMLFGMVGLLWHFLL